MYLYMLMYFSCKCNECLEGISFCSYCEIRDEIKFMQACMYVSFSRARANIL